MNKLIIIKLRQYIKLLNDVINFLIYPTSNEETKLTRSRRIMNTIMLFLMSIILGIIVALGTKFILSFVEISTNNIGISKAKELYSSLQLLLIASFILPLLEEIGFRLFLRFKPIYLALSIAVMTYFLITKSVFNTYNTDLGNNFVFRLSIALILGIIFYLISYKNFEKLIIFWKNHFRWILYFSILLFGFVHILNYELSSSVILLAPIIILPQLLSGSIYSYVRVKYGFIYSFSMHSFKNFITTTITILIEFI